MNDRMEMKKKINECQASTRADRSSGVLEAWDAREKMASPKSDQVDFISTEYQKQ